MNRIITYIDIGTLSYKNNAKIIKYMVCEPIYSKRFYHAQYDADSVTRYRSTGLEWDECSTRVVLEIWKEGSDSNKKIKMVDKKYWQVYKI